MDRKIELTKESMTMLTGVVGHYNGLKPYIVSNGTTYDLPAVFNNAVKVVEKYGGKRVQIKGWVLPPKRVGNKTYNKFFVKDIKEGK